MIRGVEGITGSLTLSFPPDKATTALGRRGCPGGLLQSRHTWAFLTGGRGPSSHLRPQHSSPQRSLPPRPSPPLPSALAFDLKPIL